MDAIKKAELEKKIATAEWLMTPEQAHKIGEDLFYETLSWLVEAREQLKQAS